ncbi:UDP-glucuronosyltransferase 2C1-like isoform X4 [Acanthochromis polyacanthus]|uniref:UDP-glucuronosyltransferase 2C1-like isoform X4 n=1 Tax=Acanthochromis polyacanthus TaxID=80966 RepID=UPI002234D7DE|nr:UDP-glucuronosyltransferase 2C1-like isoform X4 [Acanthochromis polyacanthus]
MYLSPASSESTPFSRILCRDDGWTSNYEFTLKTCQLEAHESTPSSQIRCRDEGWKSNYELSLKTCRLEAHESLSEMYRPTLAVLAVLLCSAALVNGGKVLVVPLDGSHWINMKVLIEELHSRGHEVTVIRPSDAWYIKQDSPHYKSITVNAAGGFEEDNWGQFVTRTLEMRRQGASFWTLMALQIDLVKVFHEMHRTMIVMMEEMFADNKLMQSLRDAKYDVVLTDPGLCGGVFLAHRLGLPLVFNVRWTIHGEGHLAIAPTPLSYVPLPGSELTDKMIFTERVKNMLFYFIGHFQIWFIIDPNYRPFVHRHFGPDVHYMELFQSADIWLMRNDFTFEWPRPTMPNIIYMSGFQCKPAKPLPKELEDFVQSSGEHGVIVMTLGTLVEKLPEDITEDIAAAFAQLPQKVIWRHKGKRPSTLGNNTLMMDWLPQNDLLGHPKTRVFVAHGGTNGMQEAIYHGVPLVGLPLMFDQPDNFFRMKARGVAKVLDLASVNKDNFLEALKEVLYQPSYREKMKVLSSLHRDQPMKPLDRAMFWIEFVMRHKGAAHLRTESYKMSMIQYHSIDVAAFLLAAVLLIFAVFIAAVKFVWRRLFGRNKVKKE